MVGGWGLAFGMVTKDYKSGIDSGYLWFLIYGLSFHVSK